MYPHRIRLRGPWDFEPLAWADERPQPLPPKGRMTLPCRWGDGGLGDFIGRVRFHRRFGWPGRLDPHERVWLTLAGLEGAAHLSLNGHGLGQVQGTEGSWELEVTGYLQVRNDLVAEVDGTGSHAGLWGEVALEVRCTAFLRGVRWWTASSAQAVQLHVCGNLVGISEQPLELYALVDDRTVGYSTLAPAPSGAPFHLISDTLPTNHREVRIEVVSGASVWYRIDGLV